MLGWSYQEVALRVLHILASSKLSKKTIFIQHIFQVAAPVLFLVLSMLRGILDNFPVAPLKDICDQIIGVYISPIAKITSEKLKHSLNVLDRAIKINFSNGSRLKFSECDFVINPHSLSKYGLFDKNGIDEIFNIGYQTTLDKLREHKNLVALTEKYEN